MLSILPVPAIFSLDVKGKPLVSYATDPMGTPTDQIRERSDSLSSEATMAPVIRFNPARSLSTASRFSPVRFYCFKYNRWSRRSSFRGLVELRLSGSCACCSFKWSCCSDIFTRICFHALSRQSCKAAFMPDFSLLALSCCRFCRNLPGNRPAWKVPRPIFCCCLLLLWDCPAFALINQPVVAIVVCGDANRRVSLSVLCAL